MGAIFIRYNTSEAHRILINLTDKINLKRSDKYVALLSLSLYYSATTLRHFFRDFVPINFRVIIFSDLKTSFAPCLVCNFYT